MEPKTVTPDIAAAAASLCAVLAAENTALSEMDIPQAIALLEPKQRACDQLLRAQRHGSLAATPPNHALAAQLVELSRHNKTLLERAMVAQNRILACIALALPKATAQQSPYGARGTQTRRLSPSPVAFSSRV